MNQFFEKHNALISSLSKTISIEEKSERKIQCESKIYDLYIHVLNSANEIPIIDSLMAIQEIDVIERFIMMDHYIYSHPFWCVNYSGEYPFRTSQIILNIVDKLTKNKVLNSGCSFLCSRIIKERLPILQAGNDLVANEAKQLLSTIDFNKRR